VKYSRDYKRKYDFFRSKLRKPVCISATILTVFSLHMTVANICRRLCKFVTAQVQKLCVTEGSDSTHTHPFNGPLSGTTQVSRYRRGKTNLDFTEGGDSDWQWHQLLCTSLQTDNHTSISPLSVLQAGCPSCPQPTASKH